jgi:hypothetical protein
MGFLLNSTIIKLTMPNADSSNDKTKKSNQQTRALAMNGVLWRVLHEEHTKSELRDEQFILKSLRFKRAIDDGRKRLGFSKSYKVPKDSDPSDFAIGLLHFNEHHGQDMTDDDYIAHRKHFISEVIKTTKEAGLSDSWRVYIEHYIVFNYPPEDKYLTIPKYIEVIDFIPKQEITLKLRAGLRYSDYQKAWEAFKNTLGQGKRLSKEYGDKEMTLRMLEDHNSGMSYKDITVKYYPNNDPVFNQDRVKKAIQRTRKRFERDI